MPVDRVTILDHGSPSMKSQMKALAAAEGMICIFKYFTSLIVQVGLWSCYLDICI